MASLNILIHPVNNFQLPSGARTGGGVSEYPMAQPGRAYSPVGMPIDSQKSLSSDIWAILLYCGSYKPVKKNALAIDLDLT